MPAGLKDQSRPKDSVDPRRNQYTSYNHTQRIDLRYWKLNLMTSTGIAGREVAVVSNRPGARRQSSALSET